MTSGLGAAGTDEQGSCAAWTGAPAAYLPIAEHGIIGDLRNRRTPCTIQREARL